MVGYEYYSANLIRQTCATWRCHSKVNLCSAGWMICGTLIRFRYLTDFHRFSFFGPCLKRCENTRFFYAHILMIAAVMIT